MTLSSTPTALESLKPMKSSTLNTSFTKALRSAGPPAARLVCPPAWALALVLFAARPTGVGQTVETVTTNDLFEPYGVVADVTTNLYYLTDSAHDRVVRFNPRTGEQVVLAGGDLFSPQGIVLARGGLVVSEAGSHLIRLVTLDGIVLSLAGTGERGFNNGPAAQATFSAPAGLAVDAAGNIYIADVKNNAVRRLAPDNTVSTVATGFFEPAGVAVGEGGRVFVADTRNHVIKVIEPGGAVNVIAGRLGVSGDATGVGTSARFNLPRGLLWVGGDTGLLVADTGNSAIRRVWFSAPRGAWVVEAYAGAADEPGFVNGPLTEARFNSPLGMALDQDGNLLVADLYNNALRLVRRVALPLPVVAPPGGSFSNSVTLTLTSAVPNVTFHYTTDGSPVTPLAPSTSGSLTLTGGPVPVQVRSFSPDFAASGTVSNLYSFFVDPLRLTPAGGTFSNDVTVTVATFTENAAIHFTTDGAEPTTNSPPWTNRVYGQTGPLVLRAFRDGFTPSPISSNNFTFFVAPVGIAPNGATANNDVPVTFFTETAGAELYWTIDGTDPSPTNGTRYTGPFALGTNGTLKVRGFKNGYVASAVSGAAFNLTAANPLIVPGGATNHNAVSVVMDSETVGAQIYWTIDGTDPAPGNGTLYAGPFLLATNGTLKARAFKNGYVASQIVSAEFRLTAANPVISPNGAAGNNPVTVTLGTATQDAQIYWTINGSDPTPADTLYTQPFELAQTGTLKARAFRNGFVASEVVSAVFDLTTAAPRISPPGAVSDNAVNVSLSTTTAGAEIYWTIDGSDPTPSSTRYTGPFDLATDGTLRARAFRNGFSDSPISEAVFRLTVGTPEVAPASGTFINEVPITMATTTANAELRYTLDGSEPTAASPLFTAPLNLRTSAVLRVAGFRNGFVTSPTVRRDYTVKVDPPTMSPASGFFPNGTTVSFTVQRPDAVIYYTLDGSVPTTNSFRYTGPVQINQLVSPGQDLRAVRARAFAPGTEPSDVVSGQPVPANAIGLPRDVVGGIGATIVVPVVLNLEPGTEVRSLQYRFEVTPNAGAPNLVQSLRVLSIGTNDFVSVVGPARPDQRPSFTFSTYRDVANGVATEGVIIAFIDTQADLFVSDFATVNLLAISIPPTASEGQTYTLRVVQPSATADGFQQTVPLTPLGNRTLTVQNIPYVVGDASPGGWYNAGDFGNGDLDNADVNMAFKASLGLRVPFNFTDVFDAMDAFPQDVAGAVGGDGQIRFLDWQVILRRSLRRDRENWTRVWTPGGFRQAASATLPGPLRPALLVDGAVRGELWRPQAAVRGATLGNIAPGTRARVPVTVNVAEGARLAGLAFRAVVKPEGGAPALDKPVTFSTELPNAIVLDRLRDTTLAPNEVAAAWSLLPAGFETPLTGEAQLGLISFEVPQTAPPGSAYTVEIVTADGAPDLETQYDFETRPATVWIGAPAPPDTTPTTFRQGFKLRWLAELGKRYVIESTSDLNGGSWNVVATDLAGQGKVQEYIDAAPEGAARFYRVRTKP
jgi:sugar lactone lactonase YvrE